MAGTLTQSRAEDIGHEATKRPLENPNAAASDGYIQKVYGPHTIAILDEGAAALQSRLDMIDRAQKSITLETMIFHADRSGCLILSALVKKAKEMKLQGKPFSVRLLLDNRPQGANINLAFQRQLAEVGIELRYYNAEPTKTTLQINHRNHKKTFVIDGDDDGGEMILGGRNVSDDYFDLNAHFNFVDTDLQVKGPAVKTVQKIFNRYWNSPFASKNAPDLTEVDLDIRGKLPHPLEQLPIIPTIVEQGAALGRFEQDVLRAQRAQVAQSCLNPNPQKDSLRASIQAKAAHTLKDQRSTQADVLIVASDNPDWQRTEARLGAQLYGMIKNAKQSVLIENPYFIPLEAETEIFRSKIKSGTKVDLLINDVSSSDEFATATVAMRSAKSLAAMGGNVRLFKGNPQTRRVGQTYYDDASKWGTHSKVMIVDGKDAYVGSGNFDPRSIERINAEIGLIVPDNPAFAQSLTESIQARQKESRKLEMKKQSAFSEKVEEVWENTPVNWSSLRVLILEMFKNQS
ncbi:MAG: phosphatidylserine/phosphatidylglycerophosphate/cardiolipin synthase family protein [Bdellovibrionota bacterium]